jgi:hypothetical protein
MTCAVADSWLHAARTAAELPERVSRHLAQCSRCAAHFDRLTRTDAALRLVPTANPTARAELDARLARAPQHRAEPPAPRRRAVRALAIGLAAAVVLACGWLAGRFTAPRPVAQTPSPPSEQPRPAPAPAPPAPVPVPPGARVPVAPTPRAAPELLARAARHAARVAADPAPGAQLDALELLAADVRADATARAAAGDLEPLPRLVTVHNRLVRAGVGRQLRRLPDAERAAATTRAVERLNRAADDVTSAAGRLPPAVGESLRALATACRDSSAALQRTQPPDDDGPAPATPLEVLTAQTLRVSATEAPLARADECAHLAAVLSQVACVLAIGDRADDAARVGESLNAVLELGVAANLERVEAGDTAGKLRDQVKQVRDHAARATDALERNLAKAPTAARPGLERALVASANGHGKATGHGSPWKKTDGTHPGKGGTPPGWQKKQ